MPSVFVCGDIINQFYNGQFIDRSLIDVIRGCDYAIGNLEGVVAETAESVKSMQQMPSTLSSLKDAGFNLLLLANNHITDYGQEGLKRTITELAKHNLDHVGAGFSYEETYSSKIVSINGKRFGLLNICEAQSGQYVDKKQKFGYAWIGNFEMDEIIKSTIQNSDYLIIFVHAGLEHCQLPLKQFRQLYRHYCDLGATCVIGSHPHIVQGIEYYNNSLIAYSLGNFYFPRTPIADLKNDIENNAYSIKIVINSGRPEFEVVYHGIENRVVKLTMGHKSTDILSLSEILKSPEYENLVLSQNIKAFDNTVYNLYKIALDNANYNRPLFSKFKFILKYILHRDSEHERIQKLKLLRHLNINETYKYLTEDVLSLRINSDI